MKLWSHGLKTGIFLNATLCSDTAMPYKKCSAISVYFLIFVKNFLITLSQFFFKK